MTGERGGGRTDRIASGRRRLLAPIQAHATSSACSISAKMDQGRRLRRMFLDNSFEYTRNEDEKGGEPVLGYGVTGHGRDYSLGWRLEPLDEDAPDLRLNFKFNRRESPMSRPDHGIGVELNLAW